MNIKSLILGSAAALVAGGAAQAADLPVAEPVDYVKVCDAYGAGYFFIPGTDTCLKISGSVLFRIDDNGFVNNTTRATSDINMLTEVNVTFDAKEETELGTLGAHIEFDQDVNGTGGYGSGENLAVDKAYLTIGGLYAGVTDSLYDFNAGLYYDDFGIDHGDLNAIGYNMDLGNGVTASIALEEYTGNNTGVGVTMPSVAAKLAVSQGWGSVAVAGSVYQVRYTSSAYDNDLGYSIGAKASFNLMSGLSLAVAGGYDEGYMGVLGDTYSKWAVSAGLTYAIASNLTFGIDAGLVDYDDQGYTNWGTSAQLTYTPVKNLELGARVGYQKTDWDNSSASDWDDVAGRLYIKRSF